MWNKTVNFFKAPVFSNDEEKTVRARVIHVLHINMGGVVAILGTLGVLFVFEEKRVTSLILVFTFLLIIAGMIINRRGYVKANGILILSGLWGMTVLMTSLSGGIQSLDIIFFVSGTVIAGIIFGARGTLFYAGLSMINQFGADFGWSCWCAIPTNIYLPACFGVDYSLYKPRFYRGSPASCA